MDWRNYASNDAAVQTTPVENSSVQTDETPLGVVLRNVLNDTLLPGIERLLDARLGDSRMYDAYQWLAGFGPDPSDDNDDHDPPILNNGHINHHDDDDDETPRMINGHSIN
ncbi:hypothetical protein N7486_008278 [Penicillium sp. IBT 16267x]|nr:hypothetical protein N7486_008278 [Penicillium sp. IBT 16267x]